MSQERSASLELIVRTPPAAAGVAVRETPLLFIHGAYTAAWCWEEYFLDWFAAQGYFSYALSLSGHGGSRGRKHLDSFGIADYVDDVVEVVGALPVPPVLIGHSMGGFVVQKYLERHLAPAAVLLCSVPPQGLMSSMFGLMFQKPGMLGDLNRLMSGGRLAVDGLREAMFAQPVAAADLQRYLRKAQSESHRAIWDMTLFNLPHPSRVMRTPLQVLGAERDHLIPPSLVRMTAKTYGVDAHIFPGLGHGLMLERDWQRVAEHIRDWLAGEGL
ncbi:Alpha/beta hydrolase fold protein [Sterolibacterium denitrificans]|uniref:Alpha/beta hydrolase fold protein n=2 Tax=Sterolibacterium denitrificans TaxID=157592 RepID=A0A7Z7HSQ8_9PROT|nr:alpha/beta fold hydrolase [Sterolibacterium denitrificans]KYC29347.1 hydrolase [Sterolibacterium denitrificans]SMB30974.1 Alpha/beta hydrolase fold protein [Sterolibacterium denitrificans]